MERKSYITLVYEAHRLLAQARRSRRLIPEPCEVCGNLKTLGHHFDYTRPLEVRWLCHKHHTEEHRKFGPQHQFLGQGKEYTGPVESKETRNRKLLQFRLERVNRVNFV